MVLSGSVSLYSIFSDAPFNQVFVRDMLQFHPLMDTTFFFYPHQKMFVITGLKLPTGWSSRR